MCVNTTQAHREVTTDRKWAENTNVTHEGLVYKGALCLFYNFPVHLKLYQN